VAITAGMLTIGAGGTAGTLAVSNTITIAAGGTLGFNRTDGYGGTFTNAISGSGAVRLLSGSLGLSGSQSFTGATIVSAGTLSAAAAALQGTSSIAVDGGVLSAAGYNPSAPLSVAATGSVAISGTGLSLAAVTNSGSGGRGVTFTAATGTICTTSSSPSAFNAATNDSIARGMWYALVTSSTRRQPWNLAIAHTACADSAVCCESGSTRTASGCTPARINSSRSRSAGSANGGASTPPATKITGAACWRNNSTTVGTRVSPSPVNTTIASARVKGRADRTAQNVSRSVMGTGVNVARESRELVLGERDVAL
jgi:autotransporter-associated beta strand protein